MTEEKITPCRCCGCQPEEVALVYPQVNARESPSAQPIYRCTNCGFQAVTKFTTMGDAKKLWVAMNEKHNPFIKDVYEV